MNYLFLGFLCGIVGAEYIFYNSLVNWSFLIGALLLSVVIFFWRRDKLVLCAAFFALGICFGLFYLQFFIQKPNEKYVSYYNGKELTLQGKVAELPEKDEKKTNLILEINNIRGRVLTYGPQYPEYQYDDILQITGKLEEPPVFNEFSYKDYLKGKNIYSVIRYAKIEKIGQVSGFSIKKSLYKIKLKFENAINQVLPEPEAALANGLVLGERSGFSDELLQIFIAVGIIHIVALSGYNVTIIAKNLRAVLGRLGPSAAFFLSILAIWLFVLMVGAGATIARATLMGSLALLAEKIGRRREVTRIILLTACAMVLINPFILRYDSGFQLSFVATISIIILVPMLTQKIKKWPFPAAAKEAGAATISAQLFVLPLLLLNFKKISLMAPLINVLILPFIPATMFLIFLSGIFGMLFLPLGQFLGYITFVFLKYIIWLAETFSHLPFASFNIKSKSLFWAILYWALLYFAIRFMKKRMVK